MKHLCSAIAAILLSLTSLCAQTTPTDKGYTGNIETIIGLPELAFNTTHGYRFNKYWSVGLNTGINLSWYGPVAPICAVGQLDLPNSPNSSFFINAKAGLVRSLVHDSDIITPTGQNYAIGTGIRFYRITAQLALNVVIMERYTDPCASFERETQDGYATLQLRIGYTFGAR